jgi:hypothetical protein
MTAEWGAVLADNGSTRADRLTDKFVVPPFSILDTRQGYWQSRRRAWLALGIQSELGRGNIPPGGGGGGAWLHGGQGDRQAADPKWRGAMDVSAAAALSGGWANHPSQGPARTFGQDLMRGENASAFRIGTLKDGGTVGASVSTDNQAPGTSLFDPVLCELIYRWFAPEGGTVLDPFAGGSVRGIVAAHLGHPYIGIDLSGRQIAANREQVALLAPDRPVPEWIVGDSAETLPTVPDGVDLVFSCPPYFDLEVYSDDPVDLSAMSWADFIVAYERIVGLAVGKLHRGRYAVFVVTEVRGPDGKYRGLVPATIAAFEKAGAAFYNELILVNAIGSLPIRITRQFEAQRKVGRTHQNVLVFVKGEAPRGWTYDRAAPADPQSAMFAPITIAESVAIAPVTPVGAPSAPNVPWVCSRCHLAVPAGPVIPTPDSPQEGHGLCWVCDDITEWTA